MTLILKWHSPQVFKGISPLFSFFLLDYCILWWGYRRRSIISGPCIQRNSNMDGQGQLRCRPTIPFFSPINLQEWKLRGTCAWQGSYGRCKLRKTDRPYFNPDAAIKFSQNSERPIELFYDMARKVFLRKVAATSRLPSLQLPSPAFYMHSCRVHKTFFADNPRVFGVKECREGCKKAKISSTLSHTWITLRPTQHLTLSKQKSDA